MPSTPSPLHLFDCLDATHRAIQQHLVLLRTVVDTLLDVGITPDVREQARTVRQYFGQDARQHHLDEERYVFPALLASENAELVAATRGLIQDHGWLEESWLFIEPAIAAATEGRTGFDPKELRQAMDVFEALYADHLRIEESLAYPEARRRLPAGEQAEPGRDMARRRAAMATGPD